MNAYGVLLQGFAFVFVLLFIKSAQAEDCTGNYHLFSPVPDACLEDIVTDRPHKTDTPAILDAGHVQAEIAMLEYGFSRRRADQVNLLNTELKVGVHRNLDIEAFYTPVSATLGQPTRISRHFALRAKILLAAGHHDVWLITLVPYAEGTRRKVTAAGGSLFLGYDFAMGLELELNVGYVRSLDQRSGSLLATTAATAPVFGAFSGFAELFTETFIEGSGSTSSFDFGLLYVVSRDVQLDFGAYVGLYGDIAPVTFYLGNSVRL